MSVFVFLFVAEGHPSDSRHAIAARICVSSDALKGFCGTDSVRIVFSNSMKLYYVDFAAPQQGFHALGQTDSAVLPVISPQGSTIAYATGVGNDGKTELLSKAWVCDFSETAVPQFVASPAYVPRFSKDPGVGSPQLYYSTKAMPLDGKSYVWEGAGHLVKKDLGPGTVDTVCSGGYFGGVSIDGRYAATAENSPNTFLLDMADQAAVPRYLHRVPVKKLGSDADTIIDLVCCNSSVSSSLLFPEAVLFFDFSSKIIQDSDCYHPRLGTWGVHDRIFLYTYANEFRRIFDVPAEIIIPDNVQDFGKGEKFEKQWNYPEWSNHPYFAVATVNIDRLWKNTGGMLLHEWKNEAIYLINLKDSNYLKIIETTDTSRISQVNMSWPAAWIKLAGSFKEDPLWLANTGISWFNASDKYLKKDLRIVQGSLVSLLKLQALSIYDLKGRQLWHFDKIQSHRIALPHDVLGGAYCFRYSFEHETQIHTFFLFVGQ